MAEVCDDKQKLLQPQSLEDGGERVDRDLQGRETAVVGAISSTSLQSLTGSIKRCRRRSSHSSCCQDLLSWHLLLASVVLVLASTAMVVTLPVYLQAVNTAGTAYSAVLFVWLVVTAMVSLYCCTRYSHSYLRHSIHGGHLQRVLQYGCWHGLACVAVVYALDRKRVLCHAQEPLMGLIVLYMILLYCFYRGPVLSSSKLLCLCGLLAGLFLAMDFQLNDIYLCRGQRRTSPASDGGPWSMQEHALWTIVYAGALFVYTMAWIKLENLLSHLGKRRLGNDELTTVSGQVVLSNATSPPHSPLLLQPSPSCSSPHSSQHPHQQSSQTAQQQLPAESTSTAFSAAATSVSGAATHTASVSSSTLGGQKQQQPSPAPVLQQPSPPPVLQQPSPPPALQQPSPPPVLQQYRSSASLASTASACSSVSSVTLFPSSGGSAGFTHPKLDALLFWFVLATLLTVLALFWTDFFTALGKSGSAEQFANLTTGGLLCHFRGLQPCGPTALHGWLMVLYMLLFLGSVRALCVSSRSVIFPLSVASLSLPLSALFWGACSEGGLYGIVWAPTVTGELVFSSFGLPVMVGCLIYWAKLDRDEIASKEFVQCPPPMRSSCSSGHPADHYLLDTTGSSVASNGAAPPTSAVGSRVHPSTEVIPGSDAPASSQPSSLPREYGSGDSGGVRNESFVVSSEDTSADDAAGAAGQTPGVKSHSVIVDVHHDDCAIIGEGSVAAAAEGAPSPDGGSADTAGVGDSGARTS